MKKGCICIIFVAVLIMVSACGISGTKETNLDGNWHDYAGKKLVISNYTKEAFNLMWDGETTHYVRATSVPYPLAVADFRVWYIAEGGDRSGPYVYIDTKENNSYVLCVCSVGDYGAVYITGASIQPK